VRFRTDGGKGGLAVLAQGSSDRATKRGPENGGRCISGRKGRIDTEKGTPPIHQIKRFKRLTALESERAGENLVRDGKEGPPSSPTERGRFPVIQREEKKAQGFNKEAMPLFPWEQKKVSEKKGKPSLPQKSSLSKRKRKKGFGFECRSRGKREPEKSRAKKKVHLSAARLKSATSPWKERRGEEGCSGEPGINTE